MVALGLFACSVAIVATDTGGGGEQARRLLPWGSQRVRTDRSWEWAIVAALAIGATLAAAPSFRDGVQVASLPTFLDEISGMGQSRLHPDVFWVHNDSGDEPRVYAVSRTGKWLGSYTLAGANNVDWEDMAIGPTSDGRSYLYLADIGDNTGRRPSVSVYRVREPAIDATQTPVKGTLSGVATYEFVYEDGPRDAEGFMIDPLTNDFYIVSKREIGGNHLYRSSSPSESEMNTLARVGTLSVTGTTGADISADGMQVIIRRYSSAIDSRTPPALAGSYWSRPNASVSLVDLLAQPGQTVPLVPEAQGEAIAFAVDHRGFYTTGEHGSMPGATTTEAHLTFYEILLGQVPAVF